MEQWKRITIMVTVFTFSIEFRPIDSFLTAYLTGPKVNVTLDQVSNELTPIRINYGVLGSFIAVVVADYVSYKPVMLFSGMMGMLAYLCLIDSSTMFILKVAEAGLAMLKCEIVYYGYLFAMIRDKKHYQMATGCAMAGVLSGSCISGLLGQLLVYCDDGDYSPQLYCSLAGVSFASMWVCFMPSAKRRNPFSHVDGEAAVTGKVFSKAIIQDQGITNYSTGNVDPKKVDSITTTAQTNPLKIIYDDVKLTYADHTVFRWSVWHVISMAGYLQIYLYINILYTYVADVSDDKTVLLNGLVDSLATMSAAVCSYKIGKIDVDWSRYGGTFLALSSLALGLVVCLCYFLKNIITVYVAYIAYDTLVQSAFVIVISQIGRNVKNGRYTLVLGLNVFLGIVLGTCSSLILTYIGISLPEHFLVYGGTYTVLGIVYGLAACFQKKTETRHFTRHP